MVTGRKGVKMMSLVQRSHGRRLSRWSILSSDKDAKAPLTQLKPLLPSTSQRRRWSRQANRACALLACVLLLAWKLLLRGDDSHLIPDGAESALYERNKGYMPSPLVGIGADAKHVYRTVVKNNLGSSARDSASFATPHQKQENPLFQERMYRLTAPTWSEYERKLSEFARRALSPQLARWSISRLKSKMREAGKQDGIPLQVWQTGKDLPEEVNSFEILNPSASYNFLDDALLEKWLGQHFGNSMVQKAWNMMERIVLKADLWRYLVMFVEGGYYSDTDTTCLKPLERWGRVDATVWDTGDTFSQSLSTGPPLVVVGIEVDVPDVTGWETFWTRPIQIVQWTMASEPGHPIFLDATRRVIESMQSIDNWQHERNSKAKTLMDELFSNSTTLQDRKRIVNNDAVWNNFVQLLATDPFDKGGGGLISLIEATGPGAFSDAVFSYLWARFGVHWSQIHNIQVATRIGDVAIVPITGFAPFERPDWPRWTGISRGPMSIVGDTSHPQALVNHHFSGSWRTVKDDRL